MLCRRFETELRAMQLDGLIVIGMALKKLDTDS